MTATSDFEQYASVADALAWRKEADEAHAARRVEAVRQAILYAAKHGHQAGNGYIIPIEAWAIILETVALLPPEGGE